MKPLGWGLLSLALVSILFEPLRMALWRLGDQVGGVGGVTVAFGDANSNTPFITMEFGSDNARTHVRVLLVDQCKTYIMIPVGGGF